MGAMQILLLIFTLVGILLIFIGNMADNSILMTLGTIIALLCGFFAFFTYIIDFLKNVTNTK